MRLRTFVIVVVAATLLASCGKKVVPMPSSAVRPPSAGSAAASSSGPTSSPALNSSTDATDSADSSSGGAAVRGWTPVEGQPEGRPDLSQFKPVADLPDIYFEFDRYTLRPDDHRVLDAHVSWLRARPKAQLVIEGHCDERGTGEYNIALGDRRARAAMDYLVSRGIEARRMTAISYGAQRPACVERDESCYAKNRRAHFLVKID